ncbi:histidinol dehydrogenase [Helicobacter monodelphidis]|uniref:histidinol dehydrogenase n=1 Tax=Helicobacter sp. 15-1451 TaxID=2004995 RepID=UPI000DCC74D5|nr:histidinol dehydrogenase [Helicobacter sp. 15-1451]RAX57943.1 histidinol dehydrogenase [Helicobacter sp. 15-1451]
MTQISTSDTHFHESFNKLLKRGEMDMESVLPIVNEILREVKEEQETAILRHISQFDSWQPESLDQILISKKEMKTAYDSLAPSLRDTLHLAYDRIYAFHSKQKLKSWIDFAEDGTILGQKVTPMQRAGLYIPGGKATYPSSLLMNAIPAIVAGVKDIIVCSPAIHNQVNATLLAAAHICNIQHFYKIGGASAIAFMGYGTQQFQKVDVITGPGNIFVATAKKLLFGEVNIDMIAGPSEIGVIADCSADIESLALDLLSQAEHDELASSILITPHKELANAVAQKIDEILPTLQRKEIATTSIRERGMILVTTDLQEAIDLMNLIAPEHLEILTEQPFEILPHIQNAGAIFLGHYTPEALGDYLAGPNHTLPTGGNARFSSPLSVDHFLKKSSILAFSQKGAIGLSMQCGEFAEAEGLQAHKESILFRQKLSKKV